ncbi:hypothetical protein ACI68E_003343 [Malassezia pachydermatis]|uniref:Uncharacterized protein n=1 Tax=Malassezia pachydermatis TaxID=77020 RepID=A0A0M8MP15_9BASI|nr:hypothetical protein Malapachy_4163 [Malassezia pachydermatis]KOS13977.1 hypothetical protein Malapachy_4163 [Malassezia pachydermatis]
MADAAVPMSAMDVTVWISQALGIVQGAVRAHDASQRDSWERLSVLLHECRDLIEFEHVESTIAKEIPTIMTSDENDAFNYALSLEAVSTLQQELAHWRGLATTDEDDADKTCVDASDAEPWMAAQWKEALATLKGHADSQAQAHAQALADLQATHDRDMEQVYQEHAEELESLRQEHETDIALAADEHEKALAAQATQHSLQLQAQASVHTAQMHKAHTDMTALTSSMTQLCAAIDTLDATAGTQASHIASVQSRLAASDAYMRQIETQWTAAKEALAQAHTDLSQWQHRWQHSEKGWKQTQATLAQRDDELGKKQKRLVEIERALAEVQSDMERTVHTQANVDDLQRQVREKDEEAHQLREQLRSMEPLRAEKSQLARDVHELQKLVSMYKDSTATAQQEQERTAEQLDKLQAQHFALEQTLAERTDQIQALKDSKRKYAEQLRAVKEGEARRQTQASAASDLQQRMTELEKELQAKAVEIEEADTRLLTVMKENKRLASQLKALRAESKRALQDVTNAVPKLSPTKERVARRNPVS